MLLHHLPALAKCKIVLASASPRRSELLQQIGLKFVVKPSTFEETLPKDSFPSCVAYALETARQKAIEVAQQAYEQTPDLIISADTIVEVDGDVLEKPADASDARRMLSRLSGRSHKVHTAVVLLVPRPSGSLSSETVSEAASPHVSFATTTDVEFGGLEPAAIDAYIASGEPFGKAGAYGIQGQGAVFVKKLHGDYFNVVGFPLYDFAKHLEQLIDDGVLMLPPVSD